MFALPLCSVSSDQRFRQRFGLVKKVTLENYRIDPYYPRVVRAVSEVLAKSKIVTPIEVFVHMHLLTREGIEDWRRGRVQYLERVIQCNLAKASRILRLLR